ncbi:hypothetical protein Dimus_022211 [Dionaea muscipula]
MSPIQIAIRYQGCTSRKKPRPCRTQLISTKHSKSWTRPYLIHSFLCTIIHTNTCTKPNFSQGSPTIQRSQRLHQKPQHLMLKSIQPTASYHLEQRPLHHQEKHSSIKTTINFIPSSRKPLHEKAPSLSQQIKDKETENIHFLSRHQALQHPSPVSPTSSDLCSHSSPPEEKNPHHKGYHKGPLQNRKSSPTPIHTYFHRKP